MKKSDLMFLILSIAVLAFVLRDKYLPESEIKQLLDSDGIHLVAVLVDDDCIDCLEKTLCSFNKISEMLSSVNPSLDSFLIFANQNGNNFQKAQLNPLCEQPANMILCSYDELYSQPRLPSITPSILLIKDGRILTQEVIFVPTNLQLVTARFSDTLDHLEAMLVSRGMN